MPRRFLGEPPALELVAGTEAAEDRVIAHLDAPDATVGCRADSCG